MIKHQCLEVYRGDPIADAYGLGAVALRYQAMGFAVLGLGRYSKRPHHLYGDRGGVYWASMDPAAAAWLWGQDKLAGIGIATGTRSRLIVIDLDVKHGERGDHSWTRQFGGWPAPSWNYPLVSTPSGGWHIWCRLPAGLTVPTRVGLLPGVDAKAEGGYVAAPPTMVRADSAAQDGGQALLPYRLVSGCFCTVPEAPPWLLAWISTAPALGTRHDGGHGTMDMTRIAEHGLERGARNTQLHRLACSLFARCGTSPSGQSAVRAVIEAVIARTDVSGFGRAEIERTIASALAFVQRREAEDMEAWRSVWG